MNVYKTERYTPSANKLFLVNSNVKDSILEFI